MAGLGSVGQLHCHVWRWHSETWPGVLRPLLRWGDLPGSQGGVQAVQWQKMSWYVPQTPHTFVWTRQNFGILGMASMSFVRDLNATKGCNLLKSYPWPKHKAKGLDLTVAESNATVLVSVNIWSIPPALPWWFHLFIAIELQEEKRNYLVAKSGIRVSNLWSCWVLRMLHRFPTLYLWEACTSLENFKKKICLHLPEVYPKLILLQSVKAEWRVSEL